MASKRDETMQMNGWVQDEVKQYGATFYQK
jgi:hypothetical protein